MARAEQKTIRRSNLTRVMFVALSGANVEEWRALLARNEVLVISYDNVITAAAQISPNLVHVVVAPASLPGQAQAVLQDAAREIGADVLFVDPLTSPAEAAAHVNQVAERAKLRRSTIVPSS